MIIQLAIRKVRKDGNININRLKGSREAYFGWRRKIVDLFQMKQRIVRVNPGNR